MRPLSPARAQAEGPGREARGDLPLPHARGQQSHMETVLSAVRLVAPPSAAEDGVRRTPDAPSTPSGLRKGVWCLVHELRDGTNVCSTALLPARRALV